MPKQFLCRAHRHQLSTDASATLQFWIDAMENGQLCFSQCRYQEAVQLFGGAWEAAEILFEQTQFTPMLTMNHLTASTIVLAKALNKEQQHRVSRLYMQSARNQIQQRLQDLQKAPCVTEYGELCLTMIDHCYCELFQGKDAKQCAKDEPVKKEDASPPHLH